jgi:hypothetical protein
MENTLIELTSEANRKIENASKKIRSVQNNYIDEYSTGYENQLEEAYGNLSKALINIRDAINLIYSQERKMILSEKSTQRNQLPDHVESSQNVQCKFISEGIFQCTIDSPPLLKIKAQASNYFELVCLQIQRQTIKATTDFPNRFKKFDMLFVSHISEDSSTFPSYFDNDNLAIKGILDSIIPYVCYDDSAVFCNDYYITEKTKGAPYSEVFIIKEGFLSEWKCLFPDYDFAKKLK